MKSTYVGLDSPKVSFRNSLIQEQFPANRRERRRRFRKSSLASVELEIAGIVKVSGGLRDIAADSCSVNCSPDQGKKLAPGTLVGVSITVMRGKSSLVIGCPGKIVRVGEDGVAVLFQEPLCWWPIFSLFPVNDQFFFDVVGRTL